MAAANESQGLKIAVAAFVSLTVILSVSCYFLYSAYDKSEAARAQAVEQASQAKKAQNELLTQRDDLRKIVGPRADEPENYLTEIKAEQKKVDEKIVGIASRVDAAVAKAQAAGAQGPELQETKDAVKRLVQEYQGEVNKNYISSMSRLADIFDNLALETSALSSSYVTTKRNLEQANQINETALTAQTQAATKAKADLSAEHDAHTNQRGDLLKKVDELQTDNAAKATEIANLTTQISQKNEKFDKTVGQNQTRIRELMDQVSKNEEILDIADGKVTYVDYSRNEVRTNITRGMGAHPQMVMAIFDRKAVAVPTEKPKAKIELTWVGETYSLAKIEKTYSVTDPIRVGDLIYSAAWSPNEPIEFALVGKIDVNRDGRDDRQDLRRMIEAAGGKITYDLPPPEAGKEKGKMTGRETFYVIDEQPAYREDTNKIKEASAEYSEFLKKKSEAIRELRFNGVKPLRKERLLSYLGYDFAAPVRSRAEGVDTSAIKMLVRPRQGAGAKGAGALKPEGQPKEEMEKEEK